jgi:4-amino-4-deoxy-L-arabinose transferase-like glycosyltransferase
VKFERKTQLMIVFFVFGLAIRLASIFWFTPQSRLGPFDDDGDYSYYAQNLAQTGEYYTDAKLPYRAYAWRPPLFILFEAGIMKLHGIYNFLAVRIYLAIFSMILPFAAWYLGYKLWNSATGFWAYTWAMFHPTFIHYSAFVQNDSFVLAISAWAIALSILQKTNREAFWAGILTGLSCLGRSQFVIFAGVTCLVIMIKPKMEKKMIRLIIYAVAFMIPLFPWWIRNYNVFGRFVPVSTEGGYTLWVGNNDMTVGGGETYISNPPPQLGEIDRDRWHYREAFKYMREHPHRTIELAISKVSRFWALFPRVGGRSIKLVAFCSYSVIFLLNLMGLWIWRRKLWDLAPFYGLVICLTLLHTIFPAVMRYRLPLEPILIVIASATLVYTLSKFRLPNQNP